LKAAGFTPVTFDNLVTGWQEAVKFGPFVQGDLLDRAALDVFHELALHEIVEVVPDRTVVQQLYARGAGAVRTAVGTTVRLGLKTLVPAAIVGEAAALAAEWTAHQRGAAARESRKAGEAAGLAASSLACAVAGAAAGPAGTLAGALAGAMMWIGGSATAAAATTAARHVAKRMAHE
jgi:hypothetical protein